MQDIAVTDMRGRLSLGKEVTERFGRRFHVVVMPRDVLLIPVPKDPFKDLAEMGKAIPKHLKLEDMKRIAEEKALREAKGNWERLQRLRPAKSRKPRR